MAKAARQKKYFKVDSEAWRQKLKVASLVEKARFAERHTKAEGLLKSKGIELAKIRKHSAKLLGTGALAGTLLLAGPSRVGELPPPQEIISKLRNGKGMKIAVRTPEKVLTEALSAVLPNRVGVLNRDEEKYLERLYEEVIGIKTRATLEGEHLNTVYGLIGAEQHLRRFPGDSLRLHTPAENEYGGDQPDEMLKEGMAPGLGAWGYFAPTRAELTEQLTEVERWYAVVQTLYLPDWDSRARYLRDWYKYRKVLIVNTQNGKAVVAAIADSGPAAWTGKHFGGSPEVMDYLGGERYKKGPVTVLFVDDPDNTTPLGPVEYNKEKILAEKT